MMPGSPAQIEPQAPGFLKSGGNWVIRANANVQNPGLNPGWTGAGLIVQKTKQYP